MKTLALLVVALALAGCATHTRLGSGVPFDHERPRVFVLDGKFIAVDQEPVYIMRKDATIVWQLPADQKLTFARDGIVISGEQAKDFNCKLGEGARTYSCQLVFPRSRAIYKYTIKVDLDGKPLKPLDPSMISTF